MARKHGARLIGTVTALAKFVATMATYPLIRAKVLQQTRGSASDGILHTLRTIIKEENFAGLYRGVLAMCYRAVLWNGIMMALKQKLGPRRAVSPAPSCR